MHVVGESIRCVTLKSTGMQMSSGRQRQLEYLIGPDLSCCVTVESIGRGEWVLVRIDSYWCLAGDSM